MMQKPPIVEYIEQEEKYLGTVRNIVLFVAGLLILLGFVTEWVKFTNLGESVQFSGVDILFRGGVYPELMLIPFVGLFFISASLYIAGAKKSIAQGYIPHIIGILFLIISILIALVVPLEVGFRLNGTNLIYKLNFFNNTGYGYYLTLTGSGAAIVGLIVSILIVYKMKDYQKKGLLQQKVMAIPVQRPLPPVPEFRRVWEIEQQPPRY